eukprot:1151392-Pelagomonas_calceolata.AAC.9
MHFCGCVYSARSSHSRTAQSKKAHLPAPALDSPSTQQPAGTPNAPEGVRWKGKFSWPFKVESRRKRVWASGSMADSLPDPHYLCFWLSSGLAVSSLGLRAL